MIDDFDNADVPELSDEAALAHTMDLDALDVDDVYADDPDDDESPVYIEFSDGDKSVTLSEAELDHVPDAFRVAYNGYLQAGAELDAEARSERQQLYGGAY